MKARFRYDATSPNPYDAMDGLETYLAACAIEQPLVHLVKLRVSQINGCAYCIDSHSRDLLKGGLPVEHLVLVAAWHEAGAIFDAQEKAALAWAEAVTRLGERGVPDSAYEAAAAAFDDKQLADLTIAISLMNAYNRIAISFRATPQAVAVAAPQPAAPRQRELTPSHNA